MLGSAAGHVGEAVRAEHPTIPWARLAELRSHLAHRYYDVDPDQLWRTAKVEVAAVAEALGPLVEDGSE